MISLADVELQEVQWLWKPYIPFAMVATMALTEEEEIEEQEYINERYAEEEYRREHGMGGM